MYISRPSGKLHYQLIQKCLTKHGKKRHCRLSIPAIIRTPENKRRKKWTDEQMFATIKAAQKNRTRIAIAHNTPKTTLKDRLGGRVQHNNKPGPKPYFDDEEESELF